MSDIEDIQGTLPASGTSDDAQSPERLIASIRTAIGPGATPETRAVAATACRSLLAALEARPGDSLTITPATATPPETPASPIATVLAQLAAMPRERMFDFFRQLATSPTSPVSGVLARLAEMPREQLIELINKQLRALAPAGMPITPPAGPRFHLIPIPRPRRGSEP